MIHVFRIKTRRINTLLMVLIGLQTIAYGQRNPVELTESNLPIVIIDTDGTEIVDEPKITAQMKVLNSATGINNVRDANYEYDGYIGIEIRGNTAQMFPKKSYTVETRFSDGENNNVSLMGLPEENDWVFHGPYSDKSLMRNVLAYYIGNAMGRWSPRTRFCEMIINDEYVGVFLLAEKIKRDKNRVDIAKLKPEDVEGDQLTGGYILSIDRDQPGSWNSPFMGRTGSVDVPISYVDPKYDELTVEQQEYIKEYVTDFEIALDGDDFDDPTLGYRAYIDVVSFIDYFIITELSRDLDGYRVSVFFHKDKNSKGGKLTMSPFWDYNLCFGNGNFMSAGNTEGWAEEGIGAGDWYEIPFWWDRFREDPYFETMLKYRWEALRENVLSKSNLINCIDSCKTLLQDAQERNFRKYRTLGRYVWPNYFVGDTYDEEIDYLKSWFDNRIDWLDSQIDLIEPSFTNIYDDNFALGGEVRAYPNPFTQNIFIEFDLQNTNTVDVVIRNMIGEEVCRRSQSGTAGTNAVVFNRTDLGLNGTIFFYTVIVDGKVLQSGKVIRY